MQVSRDCIATVVTDDFVPGGLVTFHSFLKHNRWFTGDLVIIHDGLTDAARQAFLTRFDGVEFRSVSLQLNDWIERLISVRPEYSVQRPQFLALDAFRISGYSKVLFCDSDLLFRADISELWSHSGSFLCCGDGPYYRNLTRDRRTFAIRESGEGSLGETFNSGFLLIDGTTINEAEHNRILNCLSPEDWQLVTEPHTDQLVLNHAFQDRKTLVNGTFNFLLKHASAQEKRTESGIHEAKVLHFNLNVKPWQTYRMIYATPDSPQLLDAFHWWNESFLDCLKVSHLRKRARSLMADGGQS